MGQVESDVFLLCHLPGLTIAEEAVPFLQDGCFLQKMTFAEYDGLTGGAHDRDREYDPDDPVFFLAAGKADLEDRAGRETTSLEMKAKSIETEMLGLLPRLDTFMHGLQLAEAAWSCLSLARPLDGFISPRHSVMFMHANEPGCFAWKDALVTTVQLQGDADHEYLFAPSLKPPPLTADDLDLAHRQADVVRAVFGSEELSSALRGLLQAQEPALGATEHAILCAIQLEELLLRGAKRQLAVTFTKRACALVPTHMQEEITEARVRSLYDLRSDYLHGRTTQDADRETLALGPALLAAAIRSLAGPLSDGADLDEILNGGLESIAVQDGWQPLGAFRRDNRLSGHRRSYVARLGGVMSVAEGVNLLWSPLLGLQCDVEAAKIGRDEPDALMPLTISELSELEDSEVRRDHFARVEAGVRLGQFPDEGRSVLMTMIGPEETPADDVIAAYAHKGVAASVIALRACGFTKFVDPALLGNFVYNGPIRLRQPTVVRQTMLIRYFDDYDRPDEDALQEASRLHDAVLDACERHPRLDALLELFRQAFLHPALDDQVRARVAFAFIESTMGRFRGGEVETLARAVSDDGTGKWVARHARKLRNRLSHKAQPEMNDGEFAHLLTFTHRLARRLIDHAARDGGDRLLGSFAKSLRQSM